MMIYFNEVLLYVIGQCFIVKNKEVLKKDKKNNELSYELE